MTGPSLPLLIFAQSARLLAQSAIQAGYTVWVADCFLDTDTPGHRKCKLPDFNSANLTQIQQHLLNLTNSEPCYLVYGSGIEFFSDLLSNLPNNITVLGNSFESVETCNSPPAFFKLLNTLNLTFPDTFFEKPAKTSQVLLSKPNRSLGGVSIETTQPDKRYVDNYYQQLINGISGSVLFVSANNATTILSHQQQFHSQQSFVLTGLEAPLVLSKKNKLFISRAISKLTQALKLKGLNSVDFMVDEDDNLFLLELNPRPSASMALIASDQVNLVQLHIEACQKGTLPIKQTIKPSYKGFYYFFAPKKITIHASTDWPNFCSDIPTEGTVIEKNHPVCSYLIEADSRESLQQKIRLYQSQLNQLFV